MTYEYIHIQSLLLLLLSLLLLLLLLSPPARVWLQRPRLWPPGRRAARGPAPTSGAGQKGATHPYIHPYINTCVHPYIHLCIHPTCIHTSSMNPYIHTSIHPITHLHNNSVHPHFHTYAPYVYRLYISCNAIQDCAMQSNAKQCNQHSAMWSTRNNMK